MAYSGLGFAAAMDAIPRGFEFGQRLFGQDSDTLNREQRDRELAQTAGYRAAMLRLQEQQARQRNDLENRQMALEEQFFPTKQELTKAQTGGLQAAAKKTQVETDWLPTVTRDELDTAAAKRHSLLAETDIARGKFPYEVGYLQNLSGQAAANANAQNLDTNLKQKFAEEQRYYELYDQDPYHPALPEPVRNRIATQEGATTNPAARPAVVAFDKGFAAYQAGDKNAYTPEIQKAVGAGIQPLLDQNSDFNPGDLQFDTLEPTDGGVLIKIKKRMVSSDGREYFEPSYITEGREPLAAGGRPRVFTPEMIHKVIGNLRTAVGYQDRHPERAAEGHIRSQAYRLSGGDPFKFEQKKFDLEVAQAKAQAKAEDQAAKIAEAEVGLRKGITTRTLEALDKELRPEDATANPDAPLTPEQIATNKAYKRLVQAIGDTVGSAPLNALETVTPNVVLGHPEIQKALDAYRAARAGEIPTAPTSGAIRNPGYPAVGGQPSAPFP